jgi:hypothetical protein
VLHERNRLPAANLGACQAARGGLPLKRHPSLRGLSDDHHTALVIAARCKRSDEASAARTWESVVAAAPSQLEPHFEIEESHLLPALRRIGEQALAERILDDHVQLRELLAVTRPTPDSVQEFGRALEAHVRYEEREIFERTQDRLPEDALVALERACDEIPRVCPAGLFGSPEG